jgi:hypothetical protein
MPLAAAVSPVGHESLLGDGLRALQMLGIFVHCEHGSVMVVAARTVSLTPNAAMFVRH